MKAKLLCRLLPLCAALATLVTPAARGETLNELYEKAKAEREVVFYSGGPCGAAPRTAPNCSCSVPRRHREGHRRLQQRLNEQI